MPVKNPAQKRNIVNQALNDIHCTGCGTCAGICPTAAIKMAVKDAVYVPTIVEDECVNCGICTTSCPQYHSGEEQSDGAVSKEDSSAFLGTYSKIYLAHARDHAIRYGAASGGVVTALLIYALEKGIISGALVTRMNKDRPLEPEPFIARTREEIIEAASSKYCPVPANIALQEILKSPDGERFAVVGSPCHIQGIRRAEEISEKLKNRIVLHLGLFCSHNNTFAGTHYLLRSLNLEEKEVAEIFYRGFGWPGKTKIVLKNGTEKVLDPFCSYGSTEWGRLYHSFFFTPTCCMFCSDVTAEGADISFGDPWLPEIMATDRQGGSILIARSAQAERLLERHDLDESIQLSSLSEAYVVRSQHNFLHFKKINLAYRIRLARFFGLARRKSTYTSEQANVLNILLAWLSLFNNRFGSKFASLSRLYPPIVSMWVHLFEVVRSSAMERDSRRQSLSDPGYNLVILNAAWHNRGDEAAIRAMLDSFLSKIQVKNVKIMLFTSDVSYFPFPEAESLPQIPEYSRNRVWHILDEITLLTLGRVAFTDKAKAYVRAVEDADIVLDAPSGPLIGDIWGGGWKELFCLLRLYIPARRGKLVFFYAPSMGPFSGRMMNWMRRRVISKARGVIVRECISAKYLREQLAIESEVTADSAFQNQISASYLERYKNNHNLSDTLGLIDSVKVVGVSILDVRWMPPYKGKDELQNAIESSMTALINWLIAEGYYILLLPQMFGFDPESELLDRFSNLNVEKIRVLDKNCDAYCQQVIISKLFAVVSMRYHPTIFASKASVPALCISYEHKMQGLAEKMGRSDLIITLDEVDAQTLIARFTYLENNYDTIKQELTKASQRLVKESQKTTERIIDELP